MEILSVPNKVSVIGVRILEVSVRRRSIVITAAINDIHSLSEYATNFWVFLCVPEHILYLLLFWSSSFYVFCFFCLRHSFSGTSQKESNFSSIDVIDYFGLLSPKEIFQSDVRFNVTFGWPLLWKGSYFRTLR